LPDICLAFLYNKALLCTLSWQLFPKVFSIKPIFLMYRFVLLCFLLFGWQLSAEAQRVIKPKEKASPLAMAIMKRDNHYLKVTYGQPMRRDREIFGKLVPYNQVWRTGANEATEFTTIRDLRFGDKLLKAGTYTIYSIPAEKEWTIILNGELGQWGNFNYEKVKDKDVLQVKANAQRIEDMYEAFTVKFVERQGGATLQLLWEQTQVDVPIEFIK